MVDTKVYLDFAAATPIDQKVQEVMQPYFVDRFYNPSSDYILAKEVKMDIENARSEVAKVLSVKPEEIFFTAGGTEANNLAISGVMDANPGKNLIISSIEHESVVDPAKKNNYKITPVDKTGKVIISKLEKLIDKDTVLISIMYANNEIGTIQALTKIKQLVINVRKDRQQKGSQVPLYFHTDACQAANYLSLNAAGLGVDLMTLNGGKIYGPKQSGVLFIHRSVNLNPQILGGGQERGIRSGTENVPAIIGFFKALNIANQMRQTESKRLEEIRDYFVKQLEKSGLNYSINGSYKNRLPNNLNLSFDGQDNETMLYKLDQHGVMCSTGSACSAQKDTISPTLLAIGLGEDQALSSLRFSLGRKTTKKQIDYTISCLVKILS